MKNAQHVEGGSLPVYTALLVPAVTTHPSLTCVQWSADCQLCFMTKNAAHILVSLQFFQAIFGESLTSQTPDHGINFDTGSVVKSTPSKDDRAIGWFKTMIQNDKVTPTKWPEYSQGEIHENTMTSCRRLIGASSLGGRFTRIS